ncbi:hypothetical protein WJX73_001521 [Symbiochloris irregularis]|uniref:BZIP domain-containing protein n=1 Tax=Symbiochloris irregularis TaxID=706552 RepID=A0AAW1P1V8_9CHLO
MQALGEFITQSSAGQAGSTSFRDFSSASVGSLRDSSTDSFELPAAPSDHRGFGSADFSSSLAWSQFLIPEASAAWTHQDWQSSWQPEPRESLSNPFAGLAAPRKQSPVEASQEGYTPRSAGHSAEGCLLDLQGSSDSAYNLADALGLGHNSCTPCNAALAGMQSPEVSRGHLVARAALVTTGSSKNAPYGKRTMKTAEERKAHRLAKNRATAAASSKRKLEAAQEVVQRHECLLRENHELLGLLRGSERQIVELRKRLASLAEAESHR